MTTLEATGMRVMLATDDSASARTAEEWVTRLRYGKPPIIDVVCVAGRGLTRPRRRPQRRHEGIGR